MLIWLQRCQYFAAPGWLTTGLSGNSPGAVWGIVFGLSGDCLGDVRGWAGSIYKIPFRIPLNSIESNSSIEFK